MSLHNVLALKAARSVAHLVNSDASWRQVFAGTRVSLGYVRSTSEWPIPDAVLLDDSPTESTLNCAIEFKPPNCDKGECVRGLGQAMTYLENYDYAMLVVPDRAVDGFEIGAYLANLLSSANVTQQRVGVSSYPVDTSVTTSGVTLLPLQLLKPVGEINDEARPRIRPKTDRTFWAFWRDTSLHEIFIVLDSADRAAGADGVRDRSLSTAYEEYRKLQTMDPQSRPRTTAGIDHRDFVGHTAVVLNHLGLWENDGILTSDGRRLVHLGRVFGPTSAPFRDAFSRQALIAGRHYELVKLVYEFQRNRQEHISSANTFVINLENYLQGEGLLRRLPTRRTTGSRRFFKAELTFWGVLLQIIRRHGSSYVVPGVGLDFDWPRMLDLLSEDLTVS